MAGSGDIIICNGVGPVIRQDTITIPHYENGICIIAWESPAGMAQDKIDRITARLQTAHDKALKVIEKATGGEEYDPG
jgi:hypothetical protein